VSIAVAVWIAVFPLLVPGTHGDRGIFVSVAQRLLAGDTLYVDVFDNKEPIFFYFVALQRMAGAWAEIASEIVQILICCVATYALVHRRAASAVCIVIAFGCVPLILAGFFYGAGGTHLPGTTLTLVACALAWNRAAFLAGAMVGLVGLVKITYLPLTGSLVLLFVFATRSPMRSVIAGGILGFALAVSVVALRAEIGPFVKIILANIAYSGNADILKADGFVGKMSARLLRVDSKLTLSFLGMVLACCNVSYLWQARGGRWRWVDDESVLTIAPIVAAIVSVAVLAFTAMWAFHFQILYVAGVLALVAVAPALSGVARTSQVIAAFLALYCSFIVAGGYRPMQIARAWAGLPAALETLSRVSPETQALLTLGPSGSYARLGASDDDRHAWRTEGWRLQCPRFHHYWFETRPILTGVLDCAKTADFLIVARTLRIDDDSTPQWVEFVRDVEDMLSASYACHFIDGVRACRRRA
jgi:hypothetical protein